MKEENTAGLLWVDPRRQLEVFQAVARRGKNMVIVTDPQQRIEWVNSVFCEHTGFTASEVLGRRPKDLLQGPDTSRATRTLIAEAVAAGRPFSVELLNYTKAGEQYWVNIECEPTHDELGALTGFIAIQTDVTEHRIDTVRAEVTRRIGDQLLACRSIGQAASVVVDELVRAYDIRAAAVWTVEPGRPTLSYVAGAVSQPEFAEWLDATSTASFAAGAAWVVGVGAPGVAWGTGARCQKTDFWQRTESGDYSRRARAARQSGIRTVCAVPVMGADGVLAVIEFGGSHTYPGYDQLPTLLEQVAQQFGAFISLVRNQLAFSALFDRSPDALIVVDMQGTVSGANHRAHELFGALLRRNISELIDNIGDLSHLTGPGTVGALYERRAHRADGTPFDVEFTISNGSGAQASLNVVAVRDLTERRRHQAAEKTIEDMRIAVDIADSTSRAKTQFLANMSHEIRTPMNAIIGLSRLCLQTELTVRQREYIAGLNKSAQGLLTIINDILDFSKIDAGKVVLEQANFETQACFERVESICGYLAADKGLRFVTSVAADVPAFLVGDAVRLGQVLLNLTGNAVKFTERGEVRVEAVLVAADDLTVELEFRVSDTGLGLTDQQVENLFTAFHQGDASSTRKYGGTGLGLAISKHLVELMGGRIWVRSIAEVGSCFYFTARFGLGERARMLSENIADTASLVAARARLQGARILVAEDNEFNQMLICELLEQCGAKVKLCSNGRDTVAMLATEAFDLVLMDVQMPVMDGYEATRRIRATPATAKQCIIAMTANAMVGDRALCLNAGMNDFETKPIDADRLYLTLAKWLPAAAPLAGGAAGLSATSPVAQAVAVQTETPPIDLSVLGKLLKVNQAKAASLARRFLESLRFDLARITANDCQPGEADLAALKDFAHKHKSAAATAGAASCATLCQTLEAACDSGDLAEATALLAQLPPLVARIAAYIEHEVE